ncbi:uncharacterized protein JCM6883_000493 [Sporobolomyces salmoneus]|uniref:uncharacterized protein n=1 Tax=Sporobolomyces salmoneus TaxID=183962 RepID=UPI00317E9555
MAAAPATPPRPRSLIKEPRLAAPADPSKPASHSASKLLAVPSTNLDLFNSKASSSFAPSAAPSSRTSSVSVASTGGKNQQQQQPGWIEKDAVNLVVSAKMHESKLSKYCSWLHCFEHARYLHAGLPQKEINWGDYPTRTSDDTPLLRNIHRYLSTREHRVYVRQPELSLETAFPEIESKEELQAAYKTGAIHFTGELGIVKGSRDGLRKVVFTLCPPSAGMGSHLFRKWGSDRFLRVKLEEDALRSCGPSFDRPEISGGKTPTIREQILSFFSRPLHIFGRQYSPFCAKDGAVIYFAEKGTGIETKDERSLGQFAQEYLDARLNPRMTVAKYCARFELGLTTTTPTVSFPRHRVLRTPDLKSDSLKISIAMMQHLRELFIKTFPGAPREFLPSGYLPSCIRGFYGSVADDKVMTPLVWQLDYTSPDSETRRYIHVHKFSSKPVIRPHFKFTILMKDGRECSIWVRLDGEQVRWEAPWREGGRRGVDMTDGCSLMSYSSMRIIAEKVAEARGAIEMKPSLPPVAQGRLGPGKGVWALAPLASWDSNQPEDRWIEVRDSQWKFEDEQTETFTFELHSVPSTKAQSAKLGKQMFEVLSHCGVPNSVFREMLRDQVQTSQHAFWEPTSMPALLYHVEKSCGIIEDRTLKAKLASDPSNIKLNAFDSTKLDADLTDVTDQPVVKEEEGFVHDRRLDPTSAAPNCVDEVVVQMLQNGFEPRKNPHLAAKLKIVSSLTLEKQLTFKVDDDFSRTAFVIADHMGVLEEGEFYFQCSEPLPTGDGFGKVGIVDGEALLSRSPAVQPCDVQKVRGVYRPEYRSYYDVIIVSTKGDRSLCSILSGGDYDGDKLICMTHPAIVRPFTNADHKFADPPFEDSDWFDVDRRRVGDSVVPLIMEGKNDQLANIFLESLFAGTQFGLLSKYHTTLAYKLGIADPLTSEAGHLFCRALDGRKQGLSFSAEKWQLAKKKFFDPHKDVPRWTYAEDGRLAGHHEKFAMRPRELGKHPMDELEKERIKVKKLTEEAWKEWCRDLPVEIDDDLAREWRGAWSYGLAQRASGNLTFFEDLEKILAHIKFVFQDYKNLVQRWARDKDNGKIEIDRNSAPGSPTKRSPSKKGFEWKSSSRQHKDELLALTRKFWSIISDSNSLKSEKLRGDDGARYARALIASCAYLEPLRPTTLPPPLGCPSLIDRFRNAVSSQGSSSEITTSTPSTIKTTTTELAPATTSTPDEREFDDLFGDTRYSQISSQTLTNPLPLDSTGPSASSSQSSTANPLSPLANRSTSAHPTTTTKPITLDISFLDANRLSIKFCYDMAHRSVLALKANSITARLHGAGARGIEAPSISESILDVMQVSKRAAGIASARLKVRPRTLLPSSSSTGLQDDSSEDTSLTS